MRARRALLLLALVAGTALAQDYPRKPIRIVVPYPPGGVTDLAARLVAPRMGETLGQPLIVENQPAAGGVVGTNALARSAPDGYTLGVVFDSFATNPWLYKGVTHDPIKDFAPISLMVRSPQLLVVHPGKGIRTIQDLLAQGKEKNRLFFSTPGAGTSSRLSSELFKSMANIDITLVSFRGGAPALNDLLGGQVTGMIASMALVLPHVQSGKLIALGVSSPTRAAQVGNVPPIADTLPGFDAQSWTGMIAPTGTPRPILDRLHAAVVKALASPEVREKLAGQGVEVVGSTQAEFGEWLARETQRWSRIIRERNITVE
ncbi:MAG: tripartite tricarboxylate transporter substrate binding protein [Pseudomonadota bacterium]|jgi:tripartite-type tricarboxylate transporter receptor subunit TctC